MTDPTRRDFLLSAGSAVAAGSLLGRFTEAASGNEPGGVAAQEPRAAESIPPHRALPVPGVHVYTDKPSYAAGETLTGYVSATVPCTIEVVRLGDDLDDPSHDEVLYSLRLDPPVMQSVHPGSYIHVENGLPAQPLAALSIECWVRLWNVHEPQGIITQLNGGDGFGLLVFPDGTPAFFTGECSDPTATTHRAQAKLALPGGPTFSPYVTPPTYGITSSP